MNGKYLFRALEYVDDRYLDMVDAAAQEATDMKQKYFSGRKPSFIFWPQPSVSACSP